MRSVLVVEDGESPYVLAAVRAWGRSGVRVGTASPHPDPRASRSRWHSQWHQARLPEDDLDGFLDDVRTAAQAGCYDVLCPADDIELLAMSAARDVLPALVPLPTHERLVQAVDKLGLAEASEGLWVAAPRTWLPWGSAPMTLPAVVKARWHWTPRTVRGARHHQAVVCSGVEELSAALESADRSGADVVLQEVVDGQQVALTVVLDEHGVAQAVCQQRTVRSSLRRTSCAARTTQVSARLLDGSLELLRRLEWRGLANLQFLVGRDGRPRVIDLNGRLYGSLALAVGAGCDVPGALLGTAAPGQVARPGVRFQALHADLLRARAERSGGLLHDVGRTLAEAPGAVHSTWSSRDPAPGLAVAADLVARRLGRA